MKPLDRAAGLAAAFVLGATPLVGVGACASARHPAPVPTSPPPVAGAHNPVARRPSVDPRDPARAHAFATIGRRAIGPFAAPGADGAIAVWVTGSSSSTKGAGQQVDVVRLGADGAPLTVPVAVATTADEITSLVVRPSGSARGGWLVVWSALMDRGEALTVLSLDDRASPRGSPVEVARTTDHIAWLDLVPGAKGAVCTWAEEASTGAASLLSVLVDAAGKPAGVPARVARHVARWGVAPPPAGGGGAGFALVDAPESKGEPTPGKLSWLQLDADARPRPRDLPIGTGANVSSDVDVVATTDGWLLGWTDRTAPDAQATLARVDGAGHVEGPTRLLEGAGSSMLVGLASGAASSLLAWESPRASAHPIRELRLVEVPREGAIRAGPRTLSLAVASRSPPEIIAAGSGFALLVVAPACVAGAGPGVCGGPLAPMLVRLGASLDPVQTEPVLLGDERSPAALAWGLRCSGDHCSALAADGASPTTIYEVDFAPRSSPFAAPVVPPPPPDAPRLTGLQTIVTAATFSDLAAVRLGDETLLATLSPPRADAKDPRARSSASATIALQPLDAAGRPVAPPSVVSTRAVAAGGLAVAAARRVEDGVAVAWVKRDGGDPQVHLARFDRRGKRLREVQLTSARGDASSVAMVAVDDGWLVAWVDGRDGGGEVYAARVDAKLDRTSREERITSAAGDASDVALAVTPGDPSRVWLAWSDSRESPAEGLGDIYLTQLHVPDARRAGDEVRLLATARHSRSPQIVAWPSEPGAGALVAWLEEGPAGLEGPAAIMVARVDAAAHPVGDPVKLALPPDSVPTGIVLAAEDGGRHVARAIVARSAGGAVTLEALRLGSDGLPVASPGALLELEAAPPFDVAASLSADDVFFDDSGKAGGEHRVRRGAVDWAPAAASGPAPTP